MFDVMEREIDAVVVSTPDHTHAVAAVAAMQNGKHVFCEKPLTRTVREARRLRETALATKVVTQMGNQGSAEPRLRRAVELVQGGVLGEVREAHVWFDGGNEPLTRPSEQPPIPSTLDWDLWLGPAEPRPFHPAYLPGTWRGWRAFGSGIVGDFGCHTGNIMFRALPGRPLETAQLHRFEAGDSVPSLAFRSHPEGYPRSMRAVFEFPAGEIRHRPRLRFYAKERPDES
jgi:predicted dehydrogenase